MLVCSYNRHYTSSLTNELHTAVSSWYSSDTRSFATEVNIKAYELHIVVHVIDFFGGCQAHIYIQMNYTLADLPHSFEKRKV